MGDEFDSGVSGTTTAASTGTCSTIPRTPPSALSKAQPHASPMALHEVDSIRPVSADRLPGQREQHVAFLRMARNPTISW